MREPLDRPRVVLLVNPKKEQAERDIEAFKPWLRERAEIVAEPDELLDSAAAGAALPEADLAIICGGDGTFLSQARALVDLELPLLGINFGKVGFLAEFFIEDVKRHWDLIRGFQCRMSYRLMIDVAVFDGGAPEWGCDGSPHRDCGAAAMPEPLFEGVAMNDAVLNAGQPFRMIEIELAIEPRVSGTSATTFAGDGIVVATPSGSTAYNLAAGGPIVSPGVPALCISALNPQSLAFRPIVYTARSETWLLLHRANEGTMLVLDGQDTFPMKAGQQVRITQHPTMLEMLHNPDFSYWKMLAHKMHWAARPRRA